MMPACLAAWTILVRQWRLHGRANIDGENLGVVSRAQDKDSELNSGVLVFVGKKQMHLFFFGGRWKSLGISSSQSHGVVSFGQVCRSPLSLFTLSFYIRRSNMSI